MAVSYFDRYRRFRENGSVKTVPGIKLLPKSTDKQVVYKKNKSRLDILSLANPQFGGLEFNIKDNEIIRIPFPLESTLEQYNSEVEKHIRLYGE